MATETRIAKQTAKTYQSVLLVRKTTQEKLDALLASQAYYTLFEHDETHPYYNQLKTAQRLVSHFEVLAGMLLSVQVGVGTIGDELDKIQATLIVKGKKKDDDIDALRSVPKVSIRNVQAIKLGEQVATVISTATFIWSYCDLAANKSKLEQLHGKKQVKKHLEVPYINISSQCGSVVKNVKKLAVMVLNLTVKKKYVRDELDKKRMLLALKTGVKNQTLDMLVALKGK